MPIPKSSQVKVSLRRLSYERKKIGSEREGRVANKGNKLKRK